MMRLFHWIADLLFPPKCILCGEILAENETDLCHICRVEAPNFPSARKSIPFVAQLCVLWYYKDTVRESLLRYKFYNARHYAPAYGKLLAMKLSQELPDFDVLTWVPVSARRRRKRGYDQVELLARAIGNELSIRPIKTLHKARHNRPQSEIKDHAQRKANVLGVYKAVSVHQFAGKRVLLLDDIVTSGHTVSEASRVLLTAGAKEVICAAVAAAGE